MCRSTYSVRSCAVPVSWALRALYVGLPACTGRARRLSAAAVGRPLPCPLTDVWGRAEPQRWVGRGGDRIVAIAGQAGRSDQIRSYHHLPERTYTRTYPPSSLGRQRQRRGAYVPVPVDTTGVGVRTCTRGRHRGGPGGPRTAHAHVAVGAPCSGTGRARAGRRATRRHGLSASVSPQPSLPALLLSCPHLSSRLRAVGGWVHQQQL